MESEVKKGMQWNYRSGDCTMIVIRKKRKKILKKEKNQTHSRYNVNRDIDVGKCKWV